MDFWSYIPFWDKLSEEQKARLLTASGEGSHPKGEILHRGSLDCVGLFLVLEGQLRVYTVSEEGKELTLYRLFPRDLCLLSASCILRGIEFDVMVSAEEDTRAIHIPPDVYQGLMEESVAVSNYTNELVSTNFSDVMWLMDQILNKKLDARLAAFLLEERSLTEGESLNLTHEQIAGHLGSAREVVTRMLRHFQGEGYVSLSRGSLRLTDVKALEKLARGSER